MARRSFGKILKMRSGRFQASYVDHAGTRRYAPDTFATRAEADNWLSNLRSRLNSNERIDQEVAAQTFEEYAVTWLLDKRETVKPKTAELYAGIIDQHLTPFLGAYPIKDITPNVVKEWRRWLLGRFQARAEAGTMPNRKATGETRTAQAYRLLHNIMATAVRDQAITVNPCNIVGAGSSSSKEREPATLAEIDIIAGQMSERYRALVYVAAWTGLRFSELAGLTRGDVVLTRLETGELSYRINVDKQTYRIKGKLYEKMPLKTEAGKRVVFLPPHMTDVLAEHMEQFTGAGNDAYVFTSRNGTPISENTINKRFRLARQEAKRDDLRFHDLRHTCATMAAQAGATIKELMHMMGHSTERAALIYQHATDERNRQIAADLSNLAAQARTREQVRETLRVIEGGKSRSQEQTGTVSDIKAVAA